MILGNCLSLIALGFLVFGPFPSGARAAPIVRSQLGELPEGTLQFRPAGEEPVTDSPVSLENDEIRLWQTTLSCDYNNGYIGWTETCRDSCKGRFHESHGGCRTYSRYGSNSGAWCWIRCW